jgi:hypothetical protein
MDAPLCPTQLLLLPLPPSSSPLLLRCGPNYGSGTAVDEIDACCKAHDDCYDSSVGYNHCSCDQAIVRCLNKITSIQNRNLVKRAMRASIVTYFDNTACRCGKQAPICMPVKSCPCQGSG